MRKVYYFLGKDEKVYTGRDIALAAKIVHDENLKTKKDLDEYIKFRCAGIESELHHVTVKDLVSMGEIVKATVLYRETHDCTLKEAINYVDALKKTIKKD